VGFYVEDGTFHQWLHTCVQVILELCFVNVYPNRIIGLKLTSNMSKKYLAKLLIWSRWMNIMNEYLVNLM